MTALSRSPWEVLPRIFELGVRRDVAESHEHGRSEPWSLPNRGFNDEGSQFGSSRQFVRACWSLDTIQTAGNATHHFFVVVVVVAREADAEEENKEDEDEDEEQATRWCGLRLEHIHGHNYPTICTARARTQPYNKASRQEAAPLDDRPSGHGSQLDKTIVCLSNTHTRPHTYLLTCPPTHAS